MASDWFPFQVLGSAKDSMQPTLHPKDLTGIIIQWQQLLAASWGLMLAALHYLRGEATGHTGRWLMTNLCVPGIFPVKNVQPSWGKSMSFPMLFHIKIPLQFWNKSNLVMVYYLLKYIARFDLLILLSILYLCSWKGLTWIFISYSIMVLSIFLPPGCASIKSIYLSVSVSS